MVLVLMGVSGSGKTTIGEMLSKRIGWPFEDGDDYHSIQNKKKMAANIPLTDEDRAPWLERIHARFVELVSQGTNEIFACSALKDSYRATLRGSLTKEQVQFVFLTAPAELLADRLSKRQHAFMPPTLLESQLATLQNPVDAWQISVAGAPDEAVQAIVKRLWELPNSGISEQQQQ